MHFPKRLGSVRRLNGETASFWKRLRLLAKIGRLTNNKHEAPWSAELASTVNCKAPGKR